MSPHRARLSALDLVVVPSGSTPADALANTVALARATEALGYRRYWIAEHHLNAGVVGTATPLVISLVAAATSTIRVGSGAVQMGHQTPLSVVEQFGILDTLYPGRIDLGIGRSGPRRPRPVGEDPGPARPARPPRVRRTTARGLLLPAPFDLRTLVGSPRFALQAALLQQPGAEVPDYESQVSDVIALLEGTYRSADGVEAHVVPGEGAQVELWILGSSGGQSARIAGRRGLPFAANYHVSPATVLEAVEAYRSAFRPGALDRPRVVVSADVVVASDAASARELASPYAEWVRSIRAGPGAVPFPTPAQAAAHRWTAEERAMVADRVETQFVGTPASVADQLEVLAAETGADELLVTTMTHRHADRVRSYELLAREWDERSRGGR